MSLLEAEDLRITFRNQERITKAVCGISFAIEKGQTVAIVGESGSGKSVTALSLTRLLPQAPTCELKGSICFNGEAILPMKGKRLRALRGKEIAYIFQEPSTSLNPVFSVGFQIAEAIKLHFPRVTNVKAQVIEALRQVGIRAPEQRYHAYPHEMSGGMQQRMMIAMALACKPQILIADEPTTALDVTIQKQIMDLLRTLREQLNMAILFITHNFALLPGFADKVLVMFQGKIVEQGPTEAVLRHPQHPYTQALIACIPKLGSHQKRLATIDEKMIRGIAPLK